MKVLLDTNFLMLPEDKKIDIFTEIKKKIPLAKFVILPSIKKELKKLNTKSSKLALQLIKKKKVKVVEPTNKDEDKPTDDQILEYGKKNKAYVATNDKELKKRCTEQNVPIIYLRSSKKIELTR